MSSSDLSKLIVPWSSCRMHSYLRSSLSVFFNLLGVSFLHALGDGTGLLVRQRREESNVIVYESPSGL